jgi:hypothetical protein
MIEHGNRSVFHNRRAGDDCENLQNEYLSLRELKGVQGERAWTEPNFGDTFELDASQRERSLQKMGKRRVERRIRLHFNLVTGDWQTRRFRRIETNRDQLDLTV